MCKDKKRKIFFVMWRKNKKNKGQMCKDSKGKNFLIYKDTKKKTC